MFVSIRLKLFILLVLANALMVAVLLSLNAASFSRSFERYVTDQEMRRMQVLIDNLGREYEVQGDWKWLRWEDPTFMNVLRASFAPQDLRNAMREGKAPPAGGFRNYFERVQIIDENTGKKLFGRRGGPDNRIFVPIIAPSSGETVARFGFAPSARLDNQFDEVFARQQQKSLTIISLIGFTIAAALAIPFSGWLVRPIQKLTVAVRRMTDGDLNVTVEEKRADELGLLARDFNKLAQVLSKNQQDRQQWVSDIAHELRTPVAIFQADIEAAQDGLRDVNDDWLAMMHQQVIRLTSLVNDLHQLSQSDAGALSYRFAPTDLNELITQTVTAFKATCAEKSIDVHWQPLAQSPVIQGDETRLRQLLDNLAQNTCRYTNGTPEQPGTLVINVIDTVDSIELSWQDSSPGVGDQDLSQLFDRLYRVDDSRSRESGGSGLGLAIVKNIVEAHEGTIEAQHSTIGGLRVLITLPKQANKP